MGDQPGRGCPGSSQEGVVVKESQHPLSCRLSPVPPALSALASLVDPRAVLALKMWKKN